MHKHLVMGMVAGLAVGAWSCGEPCQDFTSNSATERDQNTRLGVGFADTLTVGYSSGPVETTGTLPPGLAIEVTGGKILVTGTPSTAGTYTADVRPKATACAVNGSTLTNIVLQLDVRPAQCDDALSCRLLGATACTQSSACVPNAPYTMAACARTVGDAGVCVDVNGPQDVCGGAVSSGSVPTVEGASVQTCIATPAITGCHHHVCMAPP